MINGEGFFDWAVRKPLPESRWYPWKNSMTRLYYHSLEGRIAGGYWAFEDPARGMTGWHWTKGYDGTLYQHAPIWVGLAHGGPAANPKGPGGEAEGFAGEPLTEEQIQCDLRILHDFEQYRQMTFRRTGTNDHACLVEHREASQTSCPSGRYDELWARLAAGERWGDEMPDPRIDKLIAAFGGEAAVDAWNANGNSLLAGYALEQQKLGEHLHNHAAGVTGAVPEHKHESGKVVR